jgi:hypothetical protein
MPHIVSAWTRLVEYPANHLNDFCLFQALDGRWHAIGIIGTGTWASETSFFHCSSATLYGQYEKHPALLSDLEQGESKNSAPQRHAPFVVVRDGSYYMFLRRPQGTNLLLKSDDTYHWPRTPQVLFEENDARDACIQLWDGVYHWYYCQWRVIAGVGRSCIRLRRSADLEHWSEPVDVHIDTSEEVRHSRLESPFVIQQDGRYWLFVRNRALDEHCVTTVLASPVPDDFGVGERLWVAELTGVHAPELVQADGRWHIARVSGPPDQPFHAPRQGGWIELAELAFD